MKKETKFLTLAVGIALLAGGIPWALNEKKKAERQALINRAPNAATKKFRDIVKDATEAKLYFGGYESFSSPAGVPGLSYQNSQVLSSLHGSELQKLIQILHFTNWQSRRFAPAGDVSQPTNVLAFYRHGKFIGDLRFYLYVRTMRCYDMKTWRGDSVVDEQSAAYLEEHVSGIRKPN